MFMSVSYISKLMLPSLLDSVAWADTFSDSATKAAPEYQRHLHKDRKCDTGLKEDLQSLGVAARHPAQNIRVLCKCFIA